MTLRILEVEIWRGQVPLSRPFKFGIVELQELEHAVIRCLCDVGGRRVWGMAGENLTPKWFEKVAGRSLVEDVVALRATVQRVVELARGCVAAGPFQIYNIMYRKVEKELADVEPLVRQLGLSLIERAVIDAWCRDAKLPFWKTLYMPEMGNNKLGYEPSDCLRVRHTVGMADDLCELNEVLHQTGIKGLKLKLSGDVDGDEARITATMKAVAGCGVDRLTLDGNENYSDLREYECFLRCLRSSLLLAKARDILMWIEQPLRRDVALDAGVFELLTKYVEFPHIVDESDSTWQAVDTALAVGYTGTTHKNCKGVFKSIRSAKQLSTHRTINGKKMVFSGEDLTIVAPWSQAADLAVAAAAGVIDIERNGQHYADGLSAFPSSIRNEAVTCHPELYKMDLDGSVTLKIQNGKIDCSGVNQAPLGWAGESTVPSGFEQIA